MGNNIISRRTGKYRPTGGSAVDFVDIEPALDLMDGIDAAVKFANIVLGVGVTIDEETNLRCYLLLDRSASMAFGTAALTKWDYSCFLATCLGYLMLRQQDAVSLVLFGAKPWKRMGSPGRFDRKSANR